MPPSPQTPSPPERPVVCLVAGAAGTGKSTLGRAIARQAKALVIDQDVATNPLMAQIAALVGAGDDLDHPALAGPVRKARYQCLIDLAVDNRRLGRSVVMIAPFTAEISDPARWREVAAQLAPARVVLVWVSVPPDVARARRQRRNLPRDRAALTALPPPEIPPAAVPAVEHLAADGSADSMIEANRIVALVGRW